MKYTEPGYWKQVSTRTAFFIGGFAASAWAPLIPFAKIRLGIDEGFLGLLLLCLGVGSLITMPLAGTLAARFGCRLLIILASVFICISIPLLAVVDNVQEIIAALLLFGAALGTIDVVVNIQAVIVEKAAGKALMSGFHGFWSIGGFAGAGAVSGLLAIGASPCVAALGISGVVLGLIAAFGKHLLPYGSEEKAAPLFVAPQGIVLFIGILCFISFLAEGAILDWSALFLTTLRGVEYSYAGLGYSLFSVVMTAGRLTGDKLVQRFSSTKILLWGATCSATGLILAALLPNQVAAFIGFGLVGLGSANLVPVLFSALGRQTIMPANLAVSAVTTLGYAGILAGPALIGLVAQVANLAVAFMGIAVLLLIVAASARIVTR